MYINGHDYFSDLAEAIMAAKQSIMVADWMLSPEVYLKRHRLHGVLSQEWRLDNLLQRKAREGVMIYLFAWKDMIAGCGSARAEDYFNKLHKVS